MACQDGIHIKIEAVDAVWKGRGVVQRPIEEHFSARTGPFTIERPIEGLRHHGRGGADAVDCLHITTLCKVCGGTLQVCGGTLLQGLQLSDGAVPAPQPFLRCPPHKGEGDKSRHQREKQRPHWLTPRGAQKNVSLH